MKTTSNIKKQNSKKRPAFTLIELLVVISIIALLLSILLPSLSKVKKQAQAVVCQTRLKQLNVASYTYATEGNGDIPPIYNAFDGINHGISWLRYMVPYISLTPGLSTGDHDVYILNGGEGPRANEAGNKSVLACPAAVRLCSASLPLNSPTYARNSFQVELKDPVKLANCRNPSGTIFLGDALIVDQVMHEIANTNPLLGPSREPSRTGGMFYNMDPMVEPEYHPAPHDDNVNISWYDGHVSKHKRLEYDVYEDNPTVWNF